MTTKLKVFSVSGALVLAGLFGGCATGTSSPGSMANMGGMSGMSGMGSEQMDTQGMCDGRKSMMTGKSTDEQQAKMNDHMKSMTPEMRTRMQAMYEKCKTS